ncbi:hypothetical protein ACT4UT_10265 [Bacillus sp. B-TM1]
MAGSSQNYRDKEYNVTPISLFMNLILKEVAEHIIKLEAWYVKLMNQKNMFMLITNL